MYSSLTLKKIILLLGDILMLYTALFLTLIMRFGYIQGIQNWQWHFWPFTFVFTVWLMIFFINNFYDLKISYNANNLFFSISRIFIINLLLAIAVFYITADVNNGFRPQRILLIDILTSGLLIYFWRRIFYNFIKSDAIANKLLILGKSELAKNLLTEINGRSQLGFQAQIIKNIPDDLPLFCLQNKIDTLVSAVDLKENPQIAKKIFNCLSLGIDVNNITSLYEYITGMIPVEHIELNWFFDNLAERSKKLFEITKRISDIITAVIGLIITIPLTPLIILGIKISSPGPIIFKQIRVGKNGKNFTAMKFRSMINNAEKNGPQWAEKNDPRVTSFGKFLRKTRLDEIPQLINILKGEMSLVGPRPERPEFVKTLKQSIPFYEERLLVKPGLTGWAQLNGPVYGGSEKETLEKIKYDLFYIKNRSLLLDFSIILKTIKIAILGKGQ